MCCLLIPAEPPSQVASVLAGNPAVSGAIQATEAGKAITESVCLLRYDGLVLAFSEFKISRDPHCPQCGRK